MTEAATLVTKQVTTNQLTTKQRAFLRALAHPLEPVVQIGKAGLTDGVIAQLRGALETHELIKVKFAKECPVTAGDAGEPIAAAARCHAVQVVGRTLSLYRRRDHKPTIALPGTKNRNQADEGETAKKGKTAKKRRTVRKGKRPARR